MLLRFSDLFCLPFFRQSKSNKTEEELEKRKKSKKKTRQIICVVKLKFELNMSYNVFVRSFHQSRIPIFLNEYL